MPNERGGWLVGSRGRASLSVLVERLSQEPDAEITRIIGSPETPYLLVVDMSMDTGARYQQEFGDDYYVEPNALVHSAPPRHDAAAAGARARPSEASMSLAAAMAPATAATPTAPSSVTVAREPTLTANRQYPQSYLIAHTRAPLPASLEPINLQLIEQSIQESRIPGMRWRRRLSIPYGRQHLRMLAAVPAVSQDIIVAELSEDKAEKLRQVPQLTVEPNLMLHVRQAPPPVPPPPARHPSVMVAPPSAFTQTFQVLSDTGQPVPDALVIIEGVVWTFIVNHFTDSNGRVSIELAYDNVSSIYVMPKSGFWSRTIPRPALVPGEPYTIRLMSLNAFEPLREFPQKQMVGWGLRAMNIDSLDPNDFHGEGIKIGILDSGVDVTHPDLQGRIEDGFQLLTSNETGWEKDEDGHGTHVAGVIAASREGHGIRGIAPRAKLHIFKMYPGGQFDHMIDGLNRCIAAKVDIINLSTSTLVMPELPTVVDERLRAAKNEGIACIAAAGNFEGPVQYPAYSEHVLAVSSIGRVGTFPETSYHTRQLFEHPEEHGYFSALYSGSGPELDVCGPGVAVLSAIPDGRYVVWDGTSMACPHITGLAALLLAHHPDFRRQPFNQRNARRVDRLFQILRESAQPLNLSRERVGRGLPDARRAFSQPLPMRIMTGYAEEAPIIRPQASTAATLAVLESLGAVGLGNDR